MNAFESIGQITLVLIMLRAIKLKEFEVYMKNTKAARTSVALLENNEIRPKFSNNGYGGL